MFENVYGQEKVKEILSSQIKSDKVAHAYIFMGQDGVGKRFTAIEFAKILNCTTNDFTKTVDGACGRCVSCEKIAKNVHPDVHFTDFAKQAKLKEEDLERQKILKIDTIRHMQKEIATRIYEGKRKFFIVEPAEKMSGAAANSLLKTLEEPPENTVMILIGTHKETIPKTVVSRSQVLFFQPMRQDEVSSWLMSNCSLSYKEAQEIAVLSEGSLGIAKKLVDEKVEKEFSLWKELKTQKFCISEILELSKNVAKNGALECVEVMIIEAKKDFRIDPQKTAIALDWLKISRDLLLKNINAQVVLDRLFFDLSNFRNMNQKY
ncbi:MAG: DNA polymerase III subunit delta' [Endomicrobium sp.]|jgi:DNA polymerase-3 subunit delta'|nr:DNA polymerase III subunit delta' [Endomicrobium sp.]